jgi:hypothetical protein
VSEGTSYDYGPSTPRRHFVVNVQIAAERFRLNSLGSSSCLTKRQQCSPWGHNRYASSSGIPLPVPGSKCSRCNRRRRQATYHYQRASKNEIHSGTELSSGRLIANGVASSCMSSHAAGLQLRELSVLRQRRSFGMDGAPHMHEIRNGGLLRGFEHRKACHTGLITNRLSSMRWLSRGQILA